TTLSSPAVVTASPAVLSSSFLVLYSSFPSTLVSTGISTSSKIPVSNIKSSSCLS
ncbi:hypothetical protein Tco_0376736, partial [Tanacetum coccineum]